MQLVYSKAVEKGTILKNVCQNASVYFILSVIKINVLNTNGLFQDYRNRYKFYSTYNLRLHMPPVQFLLAISLPWQYRPPFEGLGLLQSLRLNCRQSGLQEDHEDQELQVPSTASQNWEQDFFSMGGPSQPGPLLMGAGLLQVRVRFWTPRPHLALHWDHWDQVLQLPGTAKWKQFQLIQLTGSI